MLPITATASRISLSRLFVDTLHRIPLISTTFPLDDARSWHVALGWVVFAGTVVHVVCLTAVYIIDISNGNLSVAVLKGSSSADDDMVHHDDDENNFYNLVQTLFSGIVVTMGFFALYFGIRYRRRKDWELFWITHNIGVSRVPPPFPVVVVAHDTPD